MRDAVYECLSPLGASLPFPRADVRGLYAEAGEVPPGLPPAVAGGYFLWVRLPPGVSAAALAARAEERARVAVQVEGMCLVPEVAGTSGAVGGGPGGEGDGHVRLCFAWEDERVLAEGIKRLAEVLRDMLEGDGEAAVEGGDRSSSQHS